MTVFFSQLINGLSLGSIYALIALGYSMVYGIILLLNFAHGDVIMVGAYMSWFVMNQLGLGPVTAVCATIITCTLLGVVIEKIAYTPLRSAPRISLLITAIGVSFFLEYTAELILGSGAKVIPAYYTNQTFRLGKVPLGLTSIITLVVTVLSMLVLTFLVQKTKLGKAMRAVSEDMDAARLMGINVNSTISFTFAVGSALAGIGSVLYCCSYPQGTLVKMYLAGEFGKDAADVNAYAAGAFYAVDRFASYKLDWGNDYNSGTLILADRYATSNSIYQMEKIDESKWDEYLDWSADFEYNKIGIPKPDLVIFLDMPVEVSQRLMTARYDGDESKKDVHEANVDFLNKCRKSALYTASKQGWAVIPCSDGEKPLPIEEIHNTILDFVKKELKEK